jgi:hypothetical protein
MYVKDFPTDNDQDKRDREKKRRGAVHHQGT